MVYTGEKKREYQREWMKQRRLEFFKDKECEECGEDDVEYLELHHIDPTTKVSHNVWSWSEIRRVEELKKCVLLCVDCHKEQTKQQRRKDHPHGTRQKYRQGCGCLKCLAANAEDKVLRSR